MVIYEVNLKIKKSIEENYLRWLRQHMQQMLEFSGFVKAELFQRRAEEESGGTSTEQSLWTVHYTIQNRNQLEDYLLHQAPQMRDQAISKFSSQFSASRRILYPC